jgi:beta-barrel assembly-enhancing protease
MATFFEKLETKEKKKPGTIAKIFSTHPLVDDRIDKVKALLARFPDRSEYTINTSDFNRVKSRLVSITNARSVTARAGGSSSEQDNKRPTLKRRQPNSADGTTPENGAPASTEPEKNERPTLKKNGSDKPSGN